MLSLITAIYSIYISAAAVYSYGYDFLPILVLVLVQLLRDNLLPYLVKSHDLLPYRAGPATLLFTHVVQPFHSAA